MLNIPMIKIQPKYSINIFVAWLQYWNRIVPSFFLTPVTPDKCSNLIKQLKNTKQTKDFITVKMLISYNYLFVLIIADLTNSSFSFATFPSIFKLASVILIDKKGDKSNTSNYRPISTLPALSKIFERALYLRLIHLFTDNSIFNPAQLGFTKHKSTQDEIINLTEFIYNAFNCK